MILNSVRVENFRGIRGPLEVTFDPATINLVEGPNGAGKSTLLEALQSALIDNHNSSAAATEAMRPRETALTPVVSVVFEHGGEIYRITKTFLDSPTSLLERRRSNGAFDPVEKRKAADEKVREMLRGDAVKGKDERLGILSVLFSPQGTQGLPQPSGNVLNDIREMLGAQVCGKHGAAFERTVEKRYDALWAATRPRKGRLTEIEDSLQKAGEAVRQCEDVMRQVADHESAALEGRRKAAEALERLDAARKEHAALAPVAERVRELLAQRAPAVSRQEAAKAREEQWRAEIDRIVRAVAKKRECEDKQPLLGAADARARTDLETRTTAGDAARTAWASSSQPDPVVEAADERARRASTFLALTRDLAAVRQRLERARSAAELRGAIERRLTELNSPDASQWEAIQAAGRGLEEARIHVEALEVRLEVTAECDLPVHVTAGQPAGDQALAAGERFVAHGDGTLEIRLPRIAALKISGPTGDAAVWRAREREHQDLLVRLLAPFGVSQWTDLNGRVQRREALAGEALRASADYEAALAGETLETVEKGERELAAACGELLRTEPRWAETPPEVEALKRQAAQMRSAWEQRRASATTEWEQALEHLREAERVAIAASSARDANDKALAEARQELATLEADGRSMPERQDELNIRRRGLEAASEIVQRIAAELASLPSDAPERLESVAGRIAQIEAEAQNNREAYRREEDKAEALLAQGPYTSKAIAEERLRQLEADRDREMLRLNAIRLLKTALDNAKAKALAGIAEPVEERATAILERIVGRPFARIRLDETMALDSVLPDGCEDAEELDRMSGGEQEQISFATRLAFAEVLADHGRQVLVLDDPFVNTDADRMPRILELIQEKSARLQFVILSCHPERYLELPDIASHHMEPAEVTA